jgi:hypothetical protein
MQQAVSADIIPNSTVGIFSHLVLNICIACLQYSFLNATLRSFCFLMYFSFPNCTYIHVSVELVTILSYCLYLKDVSESK